MADKTYRTIRHDDGTSIQTSRNVTPSWGDSSVTYVRYKGRLMGTLALCSDGMEVRPAVGQYTIGAFSAAEGARMLVRMNGGMREAS